MNIKVGDKVRSDFFGLEGIVTSIKEGYDVENHGTIEIKITKNFSTKWPDYPKVGDLEHFVYYQWEKDLKVI